MNQETARHPAPKVTRSRSADQPGSSSGERVQVAAPTGRPILGSMQRAIVRSSVVFFLVDGELRYEHDGRDNHCFTEQLRTVRRGGQPVFLDDEGTEWVLPQLVVKPGSAEARSGRKGNSRLTAG